RVPADSQQAESHLHHLWSAHCIYDGIEIALTCGLDELRGNLLGGLIPDVNDVIGPVVLGHREFVGVAGERDDPSAASEQLGKLNRIRAKSTDPKNPDHAIRAQRPGIAELLDTSIAGQPRVSERREFLEFQTTLHLDGIASRNGNEFRAASIQPKPRPAYAGTNLRVADQTMAS